MDFSADSVYEKTRKLNNSCSMLVRRRNSCLTSIVPAVRKHCHLARISRTLSVNTMNRNKSRTSNQYLSENLGEPVENIVTENLIWRNTCNRLRYGVISRDKSGFAISAEFGVRERHLVQVMFYRVRDPMPNAQSAKRGTITISLAK